MENNNVTKPKKQNSRPALVILAVIGALSVILNIYSFTSHSEEVLAYNTRIDSLISIRASLEQELITTAVDLNKYKGLSRGLDSLVNEGNIRIEEQEKKIKSLMKDQSFTARLNKKLKTELANLKRLKEEYLRKIDELLTENQKLKDKTVILEDSVGRLSSKSSELETKVTTGARIRAEYIQVKTWRKRAMGKNDKYVKTTAAKKVNKLEVCCSILDNPIADAGQKKVYLRVIAPDGLPLGDRSQGSKMFVNRDNKEEMVATTSETIYYTNKKESVCMAYEESEKIFKPGKYQVEIYVDGALAAESNFDLK